MLTESFLVTFVGNSHKMENIKDKLSVLLASYEVFYTNVHGFHWNIVGEKFFEAHAKFGELYDCLAGPIDMVAERIRALNGFPTHKMSDYLKKSKISEAPQTKDWKKNVINIQSSLGTLIKLQKEIISLAEAQKDYGTANLIAGLIEQTEKTLWFYNSYLPNNTGLNKFI